ncbi:MULTISPECIES: RagB/SusD family nutrient uptake outer membrane protein [Sphingobacterium]|uniref:RagB/SusD family nutrient uptake outer membrane protein n=1 Tax=Sphingobacterium TaxID=28453 RepID=UPI0013DAC348|nr:MULTISPECIES: RagB/SusD family nutrient uptake outer membrane protein [unclassified Sphingobacterium]
MKRKSIYIKLAFLAIALQTTSSCNDAYLERFPETAITKENFFKSANDLDMYIYNLYNYSSTEFYESDATTDNASTTGNKEIKNIMLGNVTAETMFTGWSWSRLRDINFLLENLPTSGLPEEQIKHYEGLGRYFRARFYVEKVQRFSDVPWVDRVISTTDEAALMGGRDKRDYVVQKILEDFEFAAEHVMPTSAKGSVNKWVILQEYSRFTLYEGTTRKYHSELELSSSVNDLLSKTVELTDNIIQNGGFQIHNTGNPYVDYGSLFYSDNLENNREVVFGRYYSNNVLNGSDWPGMFGNYEYYPLRDLLQNYLMSDGTPYTKDSNYATKSFVDEFKNRDPRLQQTYAFPGWELIYTSTYSQGAGIYVQQLAKNFSGYHQIKGFLNTLSLERRRNNDIPLYRYAEVLLNYAEAKAELGNLNQSDLDKSINVLRDRAGMPKLMLNVSIDPLLQQQYPSVKGSNANVILEIRRERRVELAFEGFRFNDLMRWNAGKLLEKKPQGIYFNGLGKHDLTGDGIEDIVLLSANESIPDNKEMNSKGEVLRYYRVGRIGEDVSVFLSEGNKGYIDVVDEVGEFIEPKYYYRPIPASDVRLNSNLKQIFGW